MIGKTISHYKILEKLGSGGMGIVYKAQDLKLDRVVALKFLPPELMRDEDAKKRFIHEAKAASALEHNNICAIHEIDEFEDADEPAAGKKIFIVLSCYEGESLKEKIMRAPLKIEEILDIGIQICEGISKAHEKEIIHRDIKPANIFITNDGIVKILDFGLAKVTGQTKLTKMDFTVGTAAYLSPEQAKGEPVDHRTDIWSIGVVLYEMLIGRAPFKGDYEQAITYSIINENPEPVTALRSGVPMELENIINKCLEKNPSDRYQHAAELIVDLRRMKKASDSSSRVKPADQRIKISKIKLVSYSVAGALLLFVLVMIGKYRFIDKNYSDESRKLKMLVVLPFENLGTADDQYFAEGITDEISSLLSNVKSVGVISRKSAFYYANSNVTIKEIGDELDVDYIITGTVRWAKIKDGPGRVRITPKLIQVSNDIQIWAEPYERLMTDIFEIQSEIAKKVLQHLDIELNESDLKTVERIPTENLEAWHSYLLGLSYEQKPHFTIVNWLKVVDYCQQAVDLDSTFALAYAKLSKAHSRLHFLRYDISPKRLEIAKEAAERALKLAPESAEVHISIGYYYLWALRDNHKALMEWELAAKDLPNNVDILRANADVYLLNGEFQKGINTIQKALIFSPRDASLYTDIAVFYWLTRHYEEAINACDKAAEISPDAEWAYLYKAFITWCWKGATSVSRTALETAPHDHEFYLWGMYWQNVGEKKYDQALKQLDREPGEWIIHKLYARPKSLLMAFVYLAQGKKGNIIPLLENSKSLLVRKIAEWPDDPRYHSSLGIVYALLGLKEDAIKEGRKATELLPISKNAEYGISYELDLAMIYAFLEERDKAIIQLENLLKKNTWVSIPYIKMIPAFDVLNDEPKFQELLKKYSVN